MNERYLIRERTTGEYLTEGVGSKCSKYPIDGVYESLPQGFSLDGNVMYEIISSRGTPEMFDAILKRSYTSLEGDVKEIGEELNLKIEKLGLTVRMLFSRRRDGE